jgi:L-threonylcarbamoyladenylate synthase
MRISLSQAAEWLQSGRVVAIPTETVYGLAASLNNPEAIETIFSLKGRPRQNPLIIHLADPSHLHTYVDKLPPSTHALTTAFWPGPMTLVLPIIADTIPAPVRAHLPTAAFRIPDHPLTLQLLHKTGPLVMPSANLSGKPSATSWQHVENDFGTAFLVLDGVTPPCGLESTILTYQERWTILRLGALPASTFELLLGYTPSLALTPAGQNPLCPGQLFRHYAPAAQLIPTLTFPDDLQGPVVGFSDRAYPPGCSLFALGPSHSPEIVAENLYATLRRLDSEGVKEAWLDLRIPNDHLWATLSERLLKAAQKS